MAKIVAEAFRSVAEQARAEGGTYLEGWMNGVSYMRAAAAKATGVTIDAAAAIVQISLTPPTAATAPASAPRKLRCTLMPQA